jgi:hypothetical protein
MIDGDIAREQGWVADAAKIARHGPNSGFPQKQPSRRVTQCLAPGSDGAGGPARDGAGGPVACDLLKPSPALHSQVDRDARATASAPWSAAVAGTT